MGGKLCSKWIGPFVVTNFYLYWTIATKSESTGKNFKVNGYQLMPFIINPYLFDTVIEEISLLDPTSLPSSTMT